ncbi:MAG: hypothetical protein BJ554DRAFT_6269, partial [Olpidium bornovanus]
MASRTCRAWRSALLGLTHVSFPASPALRDVGIDAVLKCFTVLNSIELGFPREPCGGGESTSQEARWLLDEIAGGFRGSPRIKTIVCPSQAIIKGAVNCPLLETLVVRVPPAMSSPDMASGMRGNVSAVIQRCLQLRRLEINNAVFWKRSPGAAAPREALEEIIINEMPKWSFHMLMKWMNGSEGSLADSMIPRSAAAAAGEPQPLPKTPRCVILPGLRSFALADNIHLPLPFIRIMRAAAPNLRELRFRHAVLAPEHLLEICSSEWPLESLEFDCCEMYDISVQCRGCPDDSDEESQTRRRRFPRLLEHITSRLPAVRKVSFAHCTFSDMQLPAEHPVILRHGVVWCAHDAMGRDGSAGNHPSHVSRPSRLRSLTILPIIFDAVDGPSMESIERQHPVLREVKVNVAYALGRRHSASGAPRADPSGVKELEIWRLHRPAADSPVADSPVVRPARLYPFLERLTLCTPKAPADLEALLHVENAANLVSLSLRYVPDSVLEHFGPGGGGGAGRFPALPNLRRLEVSVHAPAARAVLPFLFELVRAARRDPAGGETTRLEVVKVECVDGRKAPLSVRELFEALSARCPALRELHLSGFNVDAEDLASAAFPDLRRLVLKGKQLCRQVDAAWWSALASLVESHGRLRAVAIAGDVQLPSMPVKALKEILRDTAARVRPPPPQHSSFSPPLSSARRPEEPTDPAFRAARVLALATVRPGVLGHETLNADVRSQAAAGAAADAIEALEPAVVARLAGPILVCNLTARFPRLDEVTVCAPASLRC